jgi:dihydroorotate dehydrogenase (NAD+) catalytic subunit
MCETPSGMVNAIGLANIGVRAFVREKLPELRGYDTPVIANLFGHQVSEYAEIIRVLEDAEGLAVYGLSISCPNLKQGGTELPTDPFLASQVVAAARKVAKRPLWVKFSSLAGRIGLIARVCESEGADALVIRGTYQRLCINRHNKRFRLGGTTGGLPGAEIRSINPRLVHEASRAVKIPVIGLGGVENAPNVMEYLLLGARAVEVDPAYFFDPWAFADLVADLENLCREDNILGISKLRRSFETGFSCNRDCSNDTMRSFQ